MKVLKILIVLAHPDANSFNSAIAQAVCKTLENNHHDIFFHDLYAEKFDPLLYQNEFSSEAAVPDEIEEHCRQLEQADGIIIIHPNWWGQPPAILKGWIDRVIRPGRAYRFAENDSGQGIPIGLLKAQSAIVFNTSNTEANREQQIFGDPLERIWKDCIFDLCGVKNFTRRMFQILITSTGQEREQWLDEVREIVDRRFPSIENE